MPLCRWTRAVWAALVILGAPVLAGAPALANDSVAHLTAGGLEFATTDAVVMEKEDLFLSPDGVRVNYVFRNVTGRAVDLRVAFPMPRLDMRVVHGCSDVGIPFPDEANFIGFATQVNGASVPMEVQTRAFVGGRDVGALLGEARIPLAATGRELERRLKGLSAADKRRLVGAGVIEGDESCIEAPMPLWTAETIYHWQQRFEPGITRISHRYTPALGGFFVTPGERLTGPKDRLAPVNDPDLARYCIDEGTWRSMRRMTTPDGIVRAQNLEYILKTARSWRGPIGEFTLTIDKGQPDALVSLCITGIRKTGPTTFEVRRRDFVPDRDLSVLFVSGMR